MNDRPFLNPEATCVILAEFQDLQLFHGEIRIVQSSHE